MDSVGSRDACRPIRWECTLAPRGEYDWTVHVRRRRGLFVKLLWPFVIIDVVVSIGLHDLENKKSALGPDRHRLVGLVNKMTYKWAFSDCTSQSISVKLFVYNVKILPPNANLAVNMFWSRRLILTVIFKSFNVYFVILKKFLCMNVVLHCTVAYSTACVQANKLLHRYIPYATLFWSSSVVPYDVSQF